MKITVLVDNTPADNARCLNEHGLSLLIEHPEATILCDMGLSDAYALNAKVMRKDLAQDVDFAVLSHAHKDHTGGLKRFLESTESTPVFASTSVFDAHYYSWRTGQQRDISANASLSKDYAYRFRWVDKSQWVTEHIALIINNCHQYPTPYGNKHLTTERNGKEELDDFRHEISIAIKTEKGLVVVSSCSHQGAFNIMQSCCNFTRSNRVYAFIGGMHLVDSEQTENEVRRLSTIDLPFGLDRIYTGHCTSDRAKEFLLASNLPVQIFKTGDIISL